MLKDFNYKTYGHLIKTIQKSNTNLRFQDWPTCRTMRFFILRHDVDGCPKAALKLAKFEAKSGIRATYFLLLSSIYYNLLSAEYYCLPRQLITLGHEIGLHYDMQAYSMIKNKNPREIFRLHIELLSKLAGIKIRSIAAHNPSAHLNDPFRRAKGFLNAYDEQFTKKMAYFSDSCGEWRNETIEIFRSKMIPPRFQLLIHPIFWDEKSANRYNRLNCFANQEIKKIKHHVQEVKKEWTRHTKIISSQ